MERRRRSLVVAAAVVGASCVVFGIWAPQQGGRGRGHSPEADPDSVQENDPAASRRSQGLGVRADGVAAAGAKTRGRVVDAEGVGLAGVPLAFHCLEDAEVRPLGTHAVATGADGRFVGPFCEATVCVSIAGGSWVEDESWVIFPGRPSELQARERAQLLGRLMLGTEGVPNVEVRVRATEPGALPPFSRLRQRTDATGAFAFPRLEIPPCNACLDALGRCEGEPVAALGTIIELSAHHAGRAARAEVDLEAAPQEVLLSLDAPPGAGP